MKIIRNNVFETNSSSTHAISIPKDGLEFNPRILDWTPIMNFYWGDTKYGNALYIKRHEGKELIDYNFCRQRFTLYEEGLAAKLIFICLACQSEDEVKEILEIAITILKKEAVNYRENIKTAPDYEQYKHYYENKEKKIESFLENADELMEITKILDNYYLEADYCSIREMLKSFQKDESLFTKYLIDRRSYLSLGGDEYLGYYIKGIGFSSHIDEDKEFEERLDKERKLNNIYLF